MRVAVHGDLGHADGQHAVDDVGGDGPGATGEAKRNARENGPCPRSSCWYRSGPVSPVALPRTVRTWSANLDRDVFRARPGSST